MQTEISIKDKIATIEKRLKAYDEEYLELILNQNLPELRRELGEEIERTKLKLLIERKRLRETTEINNRIISFKPRKG